MIKSTRLLPLAFGLLVGAISFAIVFTGDLQTRIGWIINKPSGLLFGLSRSAISPTPTITTSPTIAPSQTDISTPDPNATPNPPVIPSVFDLVEADGTFGGADRIAFVSDRDGNPEIYSLEFSTGQISRLTFSDMADFHPRWSPDGRWIAFTSYRDGGPDIHTITATGALRQSLTGSTWFDEFPSWSPDGTWIIFDSNRPEPDAPAPGASQHESDEFRLYRMRVDGSEQQRLLDDATDGAVGTFSPDGDQIAFQSRGGEGAYQIFTYDLAVEIVVRLTHTLARNFRPSWSPEGQEIVFISERDGAGEIYVMNADGTDQRRLTHADLDHVRGPVWSPDGNWILFNAELAGNTDLFVVNLAGTQLYRVTTHPAEDYHPDWRADLP